MGRTDDLESGRWKYAALGNIYIHRAVNWPSLQNPLLFMLALVVLGGMAAGFYQCKSDVSARVNAETIGSPVAIADSVQPSLSWAEACSLVRQHADQHERWINGQVGGEVLQQGGSPISMHEISRMHRPYAALHRPYRNEFFFTTAQQELRFRNKLIEAGIKEELLAEPSDHAGMNSYRAMLMAFDTHEPERFELAYALINKKPLGIKCVLRRVESTRYEVKVSYTHHVRAASVRFSFEDSNKPQRQRTSHFYGFVPEESYHIVYRQNRWVLEPTNACES